MASVIFSPKVKMFEGFLAMCLLTKAMHFGAPNKRQEPPSLCGDAAAGSGTLWSPRHCPSGSDAAALARAGGQMLPQAASTSLCFPRCCLPRENAYWGYSEFLWSFFRSVCWCPRALGCSVLVTQPGTQRGSGQQRWIIRAVQEKLPDISRKAPCC